MRLIDDVKIKEGKGGKLSLLSPPYSIMKWRATTMVMIIITMIVVLTERIGIICKRNRMINERLQKHSAS